MISIHIYYRLKKKKNALHWEAEWTVPNNRTSS